MIVLKKVGAESDGKWFTYQEGIEVKVRPLTGTVLRDLRKQATTSKMVLEQRSRRMVPEDTVDDEKFESVIAEYMVEDWRGIGDPDGNPLEVNIENKRLLLDQPALRDWLWACAQALDVVDELEKNLPTPQPTATAEKTEEIIA
jgi:hypothetical protein